MIRGVFALAKRHPLGFAVGYGGAKTVAADALVQTCIERVDRFDPRRSAVFLLFGCVQVGFVQYQVFVNGMVRLFPSAATFAALPLAAKLRDVAGLRNVGLQVILDQFVYHPLMYFPVFYTCKELVQGSASSPAHTVGNALRRYVPNAIDDLKALWKIFIPVSIFQFSVVPLHLRVPTHATAGFIWCAILSGMHGREPRADGGGGDCAE